MTHLLHRKQCKDLAEVPAASDMLERDIRHFESNSGTKFPEEWKIPLLLEMIPDAHKNELEMSFAMGERDYNKCINT